MMKLRLSGSFSTLLCVIFIWIVGILAYFNGIEGEYIFDNRAVLLDDSRVQELTPANLKKIWTEDYWSPHILGLYRPVTTTSFLLNKAVWDSSDNRAGFGIINLIIHLLNCTLAFLLFRSLVNRNMISAFGAGILTVHPVTTEAVTNIVGRSDLLALFFILAAILAYRQYRLSDSLLWAWTVFGCSVLGSLSKETAWVIPGLLAAYEILIIQKHAEKRVWRKGFWIGLRKSARCWLIPSGSAVFLVLLWRAALYHDVPLSGVAYTDNPLLNANWVSWQITAAEIFFRGLGLILWPATLCVDYSFAQILPARFPPLSFRDGMALVAYGAMFGLILLGLRLGPRNPKSAFLLSMVLLPYLPGGNFILIASSIFGERFWYIPLVGLAGLLVLGIDHLRRQCRAQIQLIGVGIGSLVMIALIVRTNIRNEDWKTDIRLFQSAIDVSPLSARAHSSLASSIYLKAQKNNRLTEEMPEILEHSKIALSIVQDLPENQSNVKAYFDHVTYLMEASEMNKSLQIRIKHLDRALTLTSHLIEKVKGRDSGKTESPDEKQFGLRKAYRSRDLDARIYEQHARILLRLNRSEEASEAVNTALRLTPIDPNLYLLKADILKQGDQT
ncbi:MAG: tetratricopeptide repeat protein, partial [Verrucomicrobiota bacterium]